MDFSITTHVSNLDDDDDVDVNGTSHYVTSLKIRGLVNRAIATFIYCLSINLDRCLESVYCLNLQTKHGASQFN